MRVGPTALAGVIAGLWLLAHPLFAQVVQITPDQAALRSSMPMVGGWAR